MFVDLQLKQLHEKRENELRNRLQVLKNELEAEKAKVSCAQVAHALAMYIVHVQYRAPTPCMNVIDMVVLLTIQNEEDCQVQFEKQRADAANSINE